MCTQVPFNLVCILGNRKCFWILTVAPSLISCTLTHHQWCVSWGRWVFSALSTSHTLTLDRVPAAHTLHARLALYTFLHPVFPGRHWAPAWTAQLHCEIKQKIKEYFLVFSIPKSSTWMLINTKYINVYCYDKFLYAIGMCIRVKINTLFSEKWIRFTAVLLNSAGNYLALLILAIVLKWHLKRTLNLCVCTHRCAIQRKAILHSYRFRLYISFLISTGGTVRNNSQQDQPLDMSRVTIFICKNCSKDCS